ncbi:MAG TPA: O-antigen ligase family protein [Bryobacteraceae bacterium]|nr:O-antigen ligase family protein [Bryobacteraceae bacterium]
MLPPEPFLSRAARWLAFGSAVSILFSIAVSQILLGLALAALLLSGEKISLPRGILLPLALFFLGTAVALVVSPHPAEGLPQIRKLYVFLELLVVYTCLRDVRLVRAVFLTWAGFAAIDGIRGLVQFAQKLQQAHQLHRGDYAFYVGDRITGFMSHWNTFAGQQMFALLMLAAFLFFAPPARRRWIWLGCAALMCIAILLAETRAVWIGLLAGGLYLLWFWNRWAVAAVPVLVAAGYLVAPPIIQDRVNSLLHPTGVDSNAFRVVTWRTGLRMIEAHPVFGIGPEGPKYHFADWIPADVPRPLPSGWYGHLHNIYLQYAAERGIPVLLILLWLLGRMLFDYWTALRTLPPGPSDSRFLLHGGIAVILAALAEGFFEYNLGDSEVLTMFLVVVACAYRAAAMRPPASA